MIKIFVQNKPLYLIDCPNPEVEEYLHRQTTIFIDELNTPAIKTMLQQLEQPDFYAGVLMYPDVAAALEAFKSHLTVIIAAGGLVKTPANELLLIFRKGKWDLPKGKLDEGESMEECALREIEEETGAKQLKIEKPLQVTYHTYYEKEKHILKESHWYLMKVKSKSILKPQTEEDIEKCEWVPLEKLSSYTDNMHASIIDVIKNAQEQISKGTV
jgi:8-oxo-dGTP pyrophosphatase MutT (NUDIX family)